MGLDGVELVMAWEEAFGIEIADADARDLTTPRMVIDLIYSKLGGALRSGGGCLTQRGFYRVRRVLLPIAAVSRNAVKPKTSLAELVPRDRRKQFWSELHACGEGRSVPDLRRPVWCRWMVVILFGASFWMFSQWPALRAAASDAVVFFLALILAGIVCRFGFWISRPCKTDFPFNTCGDLARHMAIWNPGESGALERVLSRDEVAEIVRAIISEQLGIKEFSDDAHFVRDLGVG